MNSTSIIISAITLLLASSAYASDGNPNINKEESATIVMANGVPSSPSDPYNHWSYHHHWTNNWDCKRHDSHPPNDSIPYWEYGPCDPYYKHRQYCPKGCTVGGSGHHYEVQNSRALLSLRGSGGGGEGSSNEFKKYKDQACRNNHGQENKGYDNIVYTDLSLDTCKKKCNNYSGECYGYDYKASDYKCEVWIVPINGHKLEYRNGVDCYIKKGYNEHKGNNDHKGNNNVCPSGCIVW